MVRGECEEISALYLDCESHTSQFWILTLEKFRWQDLQFIPILYCRPV